ncbi:hypothetical protein L207DRAFT_631816 [Hyaloscypha variabilis F]|uniref:Uncharacterized protein n=1 Tax=Hyaloscypha variabilis (strain UAMH 11265 / GT02V1 / F) TaxID=1149755 RepID=A0A2J6RZ33_HYAVF|nr:hypothetical protein L207DRAFT_631816 [Hyaloscypha variabilis F]
MDPITAIGFAANILSFIDYSAKVISASVDIYGSASGDSQDSRNSDVIAREMSRFAAKLQPPSNAQLAGEEKALCNLAMECEALAKRILDLLDKLKPKNRKSKSSSLVAGIKTKFYEGERRKLEEQLSNCRDQLDLQLNHLTSSKTQDRLNALITSAKDDSARIQHLQGQIEQLDQGVAIESLTPHAQTQLRLLLGVSERACDVITQHRILESLAFEEMHGRYEDVDEAHFETLRWIFGDDISYNEEDEDSAGDDADDENEGDEHEAEDEHGDEAKTLARKLLLDWISSGAGTFHISGKLGSGKSTLMKYLCDHKRTGELLRQWAGERQLVFASFFFWKPGSKKQKSLVGLTRSLLHDVLQACPDMIQKVLPNYWDQVKATPWQAQFKLPLSDKDIRRAFSRLISDPKLYTNHCFCFFIDGLDEYEGTHQEDPKTLVDLLGSWTNFAPTTVKICVSSREYNVFMNAFSKEQRIRLQDLTRSDMMRYVFDKFRHMDRKEDQMDLAEAIVKNAQGIFLWVTLVVKRIREQIENGVNLGSLHNEIDSLPKELNDLFEHMLDSLVNSDLKAAYQTFSMVLELNWHNRSLPILSYSFLNEYTQDPMFAQREDYQGQFLTREARALRIESARKQLNACGKGLVELTDATGDTGVIISHRSISEFLSSRAQKGKMERHLNDFNALDAISQLILAEMQSTDAGDIIKSSKLYYVAIEVVRWRSTAKLDNPPYSFLVALTLAWQRHENQRDYHQDGDELTVANTDGSFCIIDMLQSNPGIKRQRVNQVLRQPIYTAALAGNLDFVQWELKRNPTSIPSFNPVRLLQCMLPNYRDEMKRGLCDVIDILHSDHNVHPETASSLFLTCLYSETPDKRNYSRPGLGDENTGVTLWHHFLLRCYDADVELFTPPHNLSYELRGLGYVVEKLLEYGADPYFYMSVTNSPHLRMRLELRVGGVAQRIQLVCSPYQQEENEFMRKALYECENMSLVDLVERWGFENKTRVLELINKNMLMFEDANDQTEGNILPEKEEIQENTIAILNVDDSATLEDGKAPPTKSGSDETEIPITSSSRGDDLAEASRSGCQKLFGLSASISIGILVLSIVVALLIQWYFG